MFLGALIQRVPATANLHNACTCSGRAYSMPTRGPTKIFSGSGPSKISKPPGRNQSIHLRPHSLNQISRINRGILAKNLPEVKRGWLDHSVERPSACPTYKKSHAKLTNKVTVAVSNHLYKYMLISVVNALKKKPIYL